MANNEIFGPFLPKILKKVSDEEAQGFARKYETPVRHLYKDGEDNVTVGIGTMIPSVKRARELVFDVIKDKETPLRRATPDEIAGAFEKIQKAPKGERWTEYDPFKNSAYDKLCMPEDFMKRKMDQDLRRSARELRAQIPRFDSIDVDAQKALLDMQYNMGSERFNARKWPKLFEAIDAQDWEKAARESHRRQVQEPRNNAIYDLFMKARERQYRGF